MRRVPVLICLAVAIVVGGPQAGATSALGASAHTETPLQANMAIARHDARALLAELRLPRGAAHRARQLPLPSLAPPRTTAIGAVAVSTWWTSQASPDAVLAYVKAHAPPDRGDRQLMTAQSTEAFIWTIDGPHLYSQQLQVAVATLANGETGIMVQAESVWMVPRPVGERVPDSVHMVAVTLRIGSGIGGMKHQRIHRYLIGGRPKVAAIVNAFNSLPIVQSGVLSCPAMFPGRPSLRLVFEARGGGPPPARAQVFVSGGKNAGSGWSSCDPIDFWIGTRSQKPLTSHNFVVRIAKLIGANIS